MSLYSVGNFFLYLGMAGVIVFTILYGFRSRWWRYIEGRALLAKSTTLAMISILTAATVYFGPDYWGRYVIRLVVYGLFTISSWFFVAVLVRQQHRAAVDRDKLLDEWLVARAHESTLSETDGQAPPVEQPLTIRRAARQRIVEMLTRDR